MVLRELLTQEKWADAEAVRLVGELGSGCGAPDCGQSPRRLLHTRKLRSRRRQGLESFDPVLKVSQKQSRCGACLQFQHLTGSRGLRRNQLRCHLHLAFPASATGRE